MRLSTALEGLGDVRLSLRNLLARSRDPRPALRYVGEEMLLRTENRLRRGVDVNGKPFKRSRRAERVGGQTLWDTGAMAGSVSYDVSAGKDLDLFSSDKRARIHYDGGTIVPKNSQYLTIPLRAKGGEYAGAFRGLARKSNRLGARARDYKGTFFIRRNGKLFLAQRVPGGEGKGALRFLFILLKRVTMPRREWLGFGPMDLQMAVERLGRHVTGEKV